MLNPKKTKDMRILKFMVLITALVVSSSAMAQFKSNSSTQASSSSSNSDGWSTFYVEYNPINYNVDISGADDESMTGFSIGYSKAFAVSPGAPVYIEAGLAGQYSFKSDFLDVDDVDFNMISAKVPVNLAYKFDLSNSSVSIIPFIGAYARYNISGKVKYTGSSKDKEWDLFDKKDMEDLGLTMDGKAFNRLQLGWQIGAKAKISDSFLVSLSYGTDFSEITKKIKVSTTAITLGYCF